VEIVSTSNLIFHGSMWARETQGMRQPRNWRAMSPEERRRYTRSWRDSPESEAFKQEVGTYEFPVQPDGTFRVEDVLPGSYRMQVRAQAIGSNPGGPAAKAEIRIEVPDGSPTDPPLDVGILMPTP
jgi:hypothetical protein